MESINHAIMEIIAVIIFAAAIGLMIMFTESGTSANISLSQNIESGTNVKESDAGYNGELKIIGSSVIFDILSVAEQCPGITINIETDENTNTVSSADLKKIADKEDGYQDTRRAILSYVDATANYKKSYFYTKTGDLTSVQYKKIN